MFRKIKQYFIARKYDKLACLDSEYFISCKGRMLAILKNRVFNDMFWFYFDLQPVVTDEAMLKMLYSESFWQGDEIRIVGSTSGLNYMASLPVLTTWSDADGSEIMSIEARPKRVLLRGPYRLP